MEKTEENCPTKTPENNTQYEIQTIITLKIKAITGSLRLMHYLGS